MSERPACGVWDIDSQRFCRNKPYTVRILHDGREVPGLCRKHAVAQMRRFEQEQHRELAFYMRYRHLLASPIKEKESSDAPEPSS